MLGLPVQQSCENRLRKPKSNLCCIRWQCFAALSVAAVVCVSILVVVLAVPNSLSSSASRPFSIHQKLYYAYHIPLHFSPSYAFICPEKAVIIKRIYSRESRYDVNSSGAKHPNSTEIIPLPPSKKVFLSSYIFSGGSLSKL